MKKILILSLVFLFLFFFASCKGGEADPGSATPGIAGGNQDHAKDNMPGSDSKNAQQKIQFYEYVEPGNLRITGNCPDKDLINTKDFNQVFEVDNMDSPKKYTYIGIYDRVNRYLMVDKNKRIDSLFYSLGNLYGTFTGKIQINGTNDYSKGPKSSTGRAIPKGVTTYGDLFALKNYKGSEPHANEDCDFVFTAEKD